MFYTSYFAKVSSLPVGYVPVAISASVPAFYTGAHYKMLCPPYDTFIKYKNGGSWENYCKEYNTKLNTMDFATTVRDIMNLAGNVENIVLLCYEKPSANCHRHLVAEWFKAHGIPCEELEL